MIFDFDIYNIWHTDNPRSPYYEQYLEEKDDDCFDSGSNYEKDNHE